MRLTSAIPPGPCGPVESFYTGLDLAERAPADRPYVVCNFVASADGKATFQGRSGPLGGKVDRAAFHLLRTQVDAVLAGTGTLEVEHYGRLIRSEEGIAIRRREERPDQPLAVVVSRSGRVPYDIPLFADPGSEVALYVPPGTVAPPSQGARVIVHDLQPDEAPLTAVMRSLRADHGVRSLLCEGGPVLFDALLGEALVDELFLTLAPVLAGGEERSVTSGPAAAALTPLRLVWALEHESELLLRYARGVESP